MEDLEQYNAESDIVDSSTVELGKNGSKIPKW
jgi:hypothetical protein